jgi:hypothetical protein
MFIKYIPLSLDAAESEEKGFLEMARYLTETGVLNEDNQNCLSTHLQWVDAHVPKPSQRAQFTHELAVTWWKLHPELFTRLNEVRKILEENEIWIEIVETEKPGTIVYEDDFQVIALLN